MAAGCVTRRFRDAANARWPTCARRDGSQFLIPNSRFPTNFPAMKTATFDTNRGTIVAELYEKDAPKTVENFETLANKGYYDGVKFPRVIPGFVVQGGDPNSRDLPVGDRRVGTGGPGYTIKCETKGNPRTHELGALSMAHAGKDTGGSQFFIVLDENNTRHLNGVHTVFGKVTTGIDVVQKIQKDDVMNSVRVA